MKGRSIYFTAFEIEMISKAFQPGNISFEGKENEEELEKTQYNIIRKTKGFAAGHRSPEDTQRSGSR